MKDMKTLTIYFTHEEMKKLYRAMQICGFSNFNDFAIWALTQEAEKSEKENPSISKN